MKSIVYQATVVTTNTGLTKIYVGLTESAFKTRYANHKASFTHRNRRVLERTSDLKMILCYIRKPCSVASIIGTQSDTPKIANIGFSPGNKT